MHTTSAETSAAAAADWMSWSYLATMTVSALEDDPFSRSVPPPPPTRLLQSAALNRKLNGTTEAAAAAYETLELNSKGRSGAVETLLAASNKARVGNMPSSSSSRSQPEAPSSKGKLCEGELVERIVDFDFSDANSSSS